MKTLFLAWQDPVGRSWYPIGRLTVNDKTYRFVYTRGARQAQEESNFQPFPPFESLDQVYESDELFALFSNRVPSPSRPDYPSFVKSLNFKQDPDDPVALLARSGGRRETDAFEVFPRPDPDKNGEYHIPFLAHGLRHLPPASTERIARLRPGERLLLVHDFQNPYDPNALALRTNNTCEQDRYFVGFCPRYLLDDAFRLVQACFDSRSPVVSVERVNPPPAPSQLRLLCNLTACWPDNIRPFSSEPYQPIAGDTAEGLIRE